MLASPRVRGLAAVSVVGLGLGLGLVGTIGTTRLARANEYEEFIDVNDQEDLDDLLAAADISQDSYDELLDVLQTGIDLEHANRAQLYSLPNLTYADVDAIIAFRDAQRGSIPDPGVLVTAGVLSQEKLLAISAFLVVAPRKSGFHVRGILRAETRYTVHDRLAPPVLLRGRLTLSKHLQVGFAATTTRLQVGSASYDPTRAALIADGPSYRVKVPKIFVKYESDQLVAVAGSLRAGFGQRLVFDDSSQYTPNGISGDDQALYLATLDRSCRLSAGELAKSPCAGDAAFDYTTPDFKWRDNMFGLAAGVKHIAAGVGWMQAYLWASVANRRIYQYELVDAAKCADPHADNDPDCQAPVIYQRDGANPLAPSPRFAFVTVPDVFSERLVGGNVAYFADRRNSVGLTAYGAGEVNRVSGIDLGTQEWSRLPLGTEQSGNAALDFGAAGVNFTFGRGWLDIAGEGAFSFDHLPDGPGPQAGGGGPAGIVRATATKKHQELEASLRYYSVDYANPFARPIAQADEFDGQRARDEAGGRLRYFGSTKRYTVRALLDLWAPVSSFAADSILGRVQPKLDSYVRADVRTSDQLWVGGWLRYQDKDLRAGGHDQCFEIITETSVTGDPIPCSGRQLTSIVRARYEPTRNLTITALLEHQLLDDNSGTRFDRKFRQDGAAWAIVHWHAADRIRVRARARYLDEAFNDGDDMYLERSLAGLVDVAFGLRAKDVLRVRVDSKVFLDARSSTAARVPNPELQLWLSYEARL